MNTASAYKLTDAGKTWPMQGVRPSAKVMLLALQIAEYERPQGVKREELRTATGLPDSSFDRAWAYMTANKLVQRQKRTK